VGHCAEAAALIASVAEQDLAAAAVAGGDRLSVDALRRLPPERAAHLLRYWLGTRGAPVPPARRLREALGQLCDARADASPCVRWDGLALRRYRGEAWLVGKEPAPLRAREWDGATLVLEDGLGVLERRLAPGGIDPAHWRSGAVEVRGRWPGMRCQPAGRAGQRDFKHLAQACGIPPWLRDQVPVVVIDGRPAAVAGCCVCEPFAVAPGQSGWWVGWRPGGRPSFSPLS
jgi:tRNA(Ile)-lysidine synthase